MNSFDNLTIALVYLLAGSIFLLMLIELGFAAILPGGDRWSKRFFIAIYSTYVMCMGVSTIDFIIYANPNLMAIERIINVLEFVFFFLPFPMMACYLLHCCGKNWKKNFFFNVILALCLSFFFLIIAAQLSPLFYYVSPGNEFFRGPLYPLLIIPHFLCNIFSLKALVKWRNKLSRKYFHAFLIYFLPGTFVSILNMFITNLLITDVTAAFCSLSMFVIILSDQIEGYMRQQSEIARQRASIMVLQMRPHFIYNTMMSIYYLCEQDPRKAQEVELNFTTYLRKNFNALVSEEMIPFSEELEHTRAYLAVEKAQFEDLLFVEYDTPHTQFRLPPLTLQPIVENAVKHGMDPDSEPLHVSIKTQETNASSIILVEDNGSGFVLSDTPAENNALANIKQRLAIMCHGEISITSRQDSGTKVKVVIPKTSGRK